MVFILALLLNYSLRLLYWLIKLFYKFLFYVITLIGFPLYIGGLLLGASTSAGILFIIIMFFYAYFLYSSKIFNITSKSLKK